MNNSVGAFFRGFGAKFNGIVRHCFQCGSQAEVDGVDGILQAYHGAFKSGLVMSGPTDISEVIMTAGALALSRQVSTEIMNGYSTFYLMCCGMTHDFPFV